MKVEFDYVITSEDLESYKLHNFKSAIDRINIPTENILHIAGSIYHDITPASKLGLATGWMNRKNEREESGADLEVSNLKRLISVMGL